MNAEIPQFIIAAPHSGSGKTTICRALMASLCAQRLKVQPFKCGPDYIDTKFHSSICGRASVNLDTFMASAEHVKALYSHFSADADVCIVEGMMGLFDGYSREKGSTAEIAELLNLPIVLVVDAHSAAFSVAAQLFGFKNFNKKLVFAGVIFNNVGSDRHAAMLRDACENVELQCFGCIPKSKVFQQSSRYLGLDFSEVSRDNDFANLINKTVDLQLLLKTTVRHRPESAAPLFPKSKNSLHTVVLKNEESFSFIYAEHLQLLQNLGTVTFLNPEENHPLPPDTNFLYLPGGYPEKHAHELSNSLITRASIKDYIESGGKALAECGGMIYLSKGINFDDEFVEMCGVLPFKISCRTADKKLHLGYRQFSYANLSIKGHEFHYSTFDDKNNLPPTIAQVLNAQGAKTDSPIFRYKNLIASYTHLYWGETNPLNLFTPNNLRP